MTQTAVTETASRTSSRAPTLAQTRLKPRMLLIVNPIATTVSARLKNLVIYALRGRYEVESVETKAQNHAIELTDAATKLTADDCFDLVVAFGGDGTVNEAANGLAGSSVPLSFLPGGCTNVACRMLGVPTDVVDATEHLLDLADRFTPRRIDLGKINGRYFLFSSGVGLDADVTRWVDNRPNAKARGGVMTFTYASISTYVRDYWHNPARLIVEAEGESYEGVSALVQNSDPFTYFGSAPLRVCDDVSIDDGALSMMVMQRARGRDAPGVVRRLFSRSGRLASHPQAASLTKLSRARVVPGAGSPCDGVPVQADGEYIGRHSEVVYEACPGALLVVA